MNHQIRQALAALDPHRDEDWVASGLPAMDAVKAILGVDVTRAQVTAAAPDFTRSSPVLASPVSPADALPPGAELRAQLVELRALKDEVEAERVAAVAETHRIDQLIAKVEAELLALSPPLTDLERYRQFLARQQDDRRKQVEAAQRIVPSTRSRLDEALGARRRTGTR